jgi:hypothetical protein
VRRIGCRGGGIDSRRLRGAHRTRNQLHHRAHNNHYDNYHCTAKRRRGARIAAAPAGPQPTTMQQLCDAQAWPRPVPAVAGLIRNEVSIGALGCWDNLAVIAPDGHDVENDTANKAQTYRITDVSPAPGTPIGPHDTVTVDVKPLETPSPALHPCDWVTPAEAAGILGSPTPTAVSASDTVGSVTPFCGYNTGDNLVTSQLYLPGSFPVDAAAQFNMGTAADEQSTDIAGLPGPAHCTTAQHDKGLLRTVNVLPSGNRLYSVDGINLTCDTLKQFAQIAILRLGM